MSPEQVRGETIDARSNLFSLGAIFYEMVTAQKPFDQEDAASLRQSILESTPVPPIQLNPKLHPLLSDLIMKALAKDPGERYQNGRELLDDLENCKESKAPAAKQAAAPAKNPAIPDSVKAATQAKFVGASAPPAATRPASAASASSRPAEAKPTAAAPVEKKIAAPAAAATKVTATAAGAGGQAVSSAQVKSVVSAAASPSASMSSSILDEPAVDAAQVDAPRIAVDPMMAGDAPSRGGSVSFSDMTELPPLKEVYIPPPPPPAFDHTSAHVPSVTTYEGELEEKPKIQSREIAQRAVKEIKNVPPSLMVYSIAGAAVLILIIAIILVFHVNSLNSDGDSPRPTATDSAQPAVRQPAAKPKPQPAQTQPAQPAATQAQPPAPVAEPEPAPTHVAATAPKGKNSRKKPALAALVVVPGQMAIDSTPQGAQVQIDGRTNPTWITPFTLSGLGPGQHTVAVSKAGYSTDTRTVDVTSGGKSFVTTRLAQLVATLAVSSTPAGANIFVDGKNSSKLTPAQVPVDQGQHVVLVRKSGYIDETTSAQFTLGPTTNFAPTLRSLGNVDNIRTAGRMKKLFGGKDAQGMGTISVKTQPKGAQVAVNQHMLEKDSPVDFMLDPGNYIVDITMSGYVSIHKVITVDKGGKAVIDEVMQHE